MPDILEITEVPTLVEVSADGPPGPIGPAGPNGADGAPIFAFNFVDIAPGDRLIVHVPAAITITKLNGVIDGGTSVELQVQHGASMAALANVEASFTVTSTTTGTEQTSGFDDDSIPGSSFLVVDVLAAVGATSCALTVEYSVDP